MSGADLRSALQENVLVGVELARHGSRDRHIEGVPSKLGTYVV
jgi:hypothetical protein